MAERKTASGLYVVSRGDTADVPPTEAGQAKQRMTHADRIKAGRAKVQQTFAAMAERIGAKEQPEEQPEERATMLDGQPVLATIVPGRAKPKRVKKPKAEGKRADEGAKAGKAEQPEEVKCHMCTKPGADRKVELKDGRGRVLRFWWFHEGKCLDRWKRNNPPANHDTRRAAKLAAARRDRRITRRALHFINAAQMAEMVGPIQITHRPDRCVKCHHVGRDVAPIPCGKHSEQFRNPHWRYLCADCAAPYIEREAAKLMQGRQYELAPAV